MRVSFHPHAIHDVMCLSVRWSFLVSLSAVSLHLLPLFFFILPVLCPALHPQCRHRRGLKPLHSRRMKSIAPWRYTILSHNTVAPSASLYTESSTRAQRNMKRAAGTSLCGQTGMRSYRTAVLHQSRVTYSSTIG